MRHKGNKGLAQGSRKIFRGISPRAFEHEADRAALASLRKMTGFDTVLKKIVGALGERRLRLLFLANAVRINQRQRSDLYHTFAEACNTLDLVEMPELYITQSPLLNAMAIGIDRPFVVVNSAMVESCSKEELRCVLGHEAGHILSGHALYRTMLFVLLRAMDMVMPRALVMMALPILIALYEWSRKSELSADRAGLLVSQDIEVSNRVCMKLAGGGDINEYSLEEFERQAKEYNDEGTVSDNLFKFFNLIWVTHPFPVLRIVELKKWHTSGHYEQILEGNYIRRSKDEDFEMREDIREGAKKYKESFSDGNDSLSSLFQDAMETGGDFFHDLSSFFRERKAARQTSTRDSKNS